MVHPHRIALAGWRLWLMQFHFSFLVFSTFNFSHSISIDESSSLEGACRTCNLSENTNSHHTFHPIFNTVYLFIKLFMLFIHSYNRLLYCTFTFYHDFSIMNDFWGCWILGNSWFLGIIRCYEGFILS